MTTTRLALVLTCLLGFARPAGRAQTVLPAWSVSGSLETGFGYNDNLLLSHSGEERSAFVRSRAEIFVFNFPQGPLEGSLLGEVTGTRYFSGKTVNHQAGAWLNLEPGYRLAKTMKLSLPVTGYYRDEVLDVSDTEVERLVAAWKLWGAAIAPTLRWNFLPAWRLEASASGDRRRYDDHSNDSRVGAGQVRLAWRPAGFFEARLTTTRRWRDFDARAQYNAAGFELAGTKLKIAEREAELRLDVTWDRAKHWKTSTRANLLDYRDNGSGFFNYREKGIGQELEWKTDRWLARLEGTASRLDFDVQTEGLGVDPPALVKDQFSVEGRLERVLSPRWTCFGGYRWERRRSNDRVASYAVNEGLLGLRWSWEK